MSHEIYSPPPPPILAESPITSRKEEGKAVKVVDVKLKKVNKSLNRSLVRAKSKIRMYVIC